jgi:uncharacterized protein YjbI with pentapeptide repeats
VKKHIVEGLNYAGMDKSHQSWGSAEYRRVNFQGVKANGAHLEDCALLNCDLRGVQFIGSTFRLSCKQGANNQLDAMNASLFLMWFLRMFDLPSEMQSRIRAAIGPDFDRVKQQFELQEFS